MQDLPHHYRVAATAGTEGTITLSTAGVADLRSAAPAEFGGPGDQWSPESLLVAAVADCFVLSFRAVATASRVNWNTIACEVKGKLERIERDIQFTEFAVSVTLDVPPTTDEAKARRALQKAEKVCLITNSLKADSQLTETIRTSMA